MATVIDIPDPPAVSALEPRRQFLCLVALIAIRDAVGCVRFEPNPDGWSILRIRDGAWIDCMEPVERGIEVERTLRTLTRRSGWLGRLGFADPSGGFSFRVAPGVGIACRVTRVGASHLMSVEPRDFPADRADEWLRVFVANWKRFHPDLTETVTGPGAAPDPAR